MEAGDTLFVLSTTVSLQEFTKGNRDVIIQGEETCNWTINITWYY